MCLRAEHTKIRYDIVFSYRTVHLEVDFTDLEEAAETEVTAEKHGVDEPDMSANGFDYEFDAELEAALNEGEEEPVSHENSLQPSGDDTVADHDSEDKASENNVPPAETSGEGAALAHLKSNNKAIVPGMQADDLNLVLSAEKPPTPPRSPASSNPNKVSTLSTCSSPRALSCSPGTSIISISDEVSPGPRDPITSAPQGSPCSSKADSRKPSAAPKRSAKPRPEYVGLSFRDRRPLTNKDRETVRKAIEYTHRDLYSRTKIQLGTLDREKGKLEHYDTTLESFAYQYARAQHRFKQYHESMDLKAGINTTTKKYQKRINRRFEETELLFEVEGPWRTGFDDWKTPGTTEAIGIIDLSGE